MLTSPTGNSLTMDIYEGFARGRLDRWDAIFHPDVRINSPAGRDIVGRDALKAWCRPSSRPSVRVSICSTITWRAIADS